MRALVVQEVGGPFHDTRLPKPTPGRGEVLVSIHASGVNPLDSKIRAGAAAHARHPLPAVLGMDLAGVVEAIGSEVEGFQVGDEVYGLTGGVGGLQGSLAEFAVVDANLLAHKPANLSMREAAALPLVVITAWEGLIDQAQTRPGQKVLVHGGAGGVGHVAVQIAKSMGAEVFATGRPEQADVIRGFGAQPIDFTTTSVEQYVALYTGGEGFDVVYDTVGGATLDAAFVAARTYGGHVVSCLGWGTHKLAPLSFRAATYSGVFTLLPMLTGKGRANHGRILREAAKMVEAGQLLPLMDPRRFDLGAALEAHEAVAAGHARGRIVVDVRSH
ncbi:MAG: zinc-dependent alcohol dehydrogenase family protein [Burkholderiales bacterium]|nr:zinc-dependent alcohol dehydrogenase family protein [Burkholderiales bacterium]MDE2434380.1 zinc-dependent alcohol dehydrogenase family protein [Burkholderiales bacterium]